MNFKEQKRRFQIFPLENAILTFCGVDGYDVYNCSIPFEIKGKQYIYGRVEKRVDWARSRVLLFENTGIDIWTRVTDSNIYQLEDPNISIIGGQLILGGVHVVKDQEMSDTYYNYFYKGIDLEDMYYFETGPKNMKDIRLVELPKGKIGLFSRPRGEHIYNKYGCESMVGYTEINSLDELSASVIENATYIEGMFDKDEWGGCNQLYYLDSGMIGIIGHQCYKEISNEVDKPLQVYVNMAFVFDPETRRIIDKKVIAVRNNFPQHIPKKPHLVDCAFPSGIVARSDSKFDLYSGIGDAAEGRVVVDYPFEGYGNIVNFSKL